MSIPHSCSACGSQLGHCQCPQFAFSIGQSSHPHSSTQLLSRGATRYQAEATPSLSDSQFNPTLHSNLLPAWTGDAESRLSEADIRAAYDQIYAMAQVAAAARSASATPSQAFTPLPQTPYSPAYGRDTARPPLTPSRNRQAAVPTQQPPLPAPAFDLVRFWQHVSWKYPILYHLALDTLPVQASAVPCERVFSSSKETCGLRRNRISTVAMERLQILKYLFKQARLDSSSDWVNTYEELEHQEAEAAALEDATHKAPSFSESPSSPGLFSALAAVPPSVFNSEVFYSALDNPIL